jgi:hypothetical protein
MGNDTFTLSVGVSGTGSVSGNDTSAKRQAFSDANQYCAKIGKLRERQEKTVPLLAQFKAWLDHAVHTVLPKDTFGLAVNYALKHWEALTNFTNAGHLDASNNYAERCMRPVAVGRKAFQFVGSERAGHAAAIYYSLVESCKANKVNPLTYLTYVLANARSKSVTLPTPDEFTTSNIAHVG